VGLFTSLVTFLWLITKCVMCVHRVQATWSHTDKFQSLPLIRQPGIVKQKDGLCFQYHR